MINLPIIYDDDSPEVHYIYVLRPKDAKLTFSTERRRGCPYKIGKTKDLKHRIRMLGILMPFDIDVVYTIPTLPQYLSWAERYLHRKLANSRLNGEWFALTWGQLDWIDMIESPFAPDLWPEYEQSLDRFYTISMSKSRK